MPRKGEYKPITISTKKELIWRVVDRYNKGSVELSEEHFKAISLQDMTAKEFIEAYNEIQKRCNEDRLVSVIDGKVSNMLIINDKYAQIIYMGVHADEALEQIRQSKDFARKTSEGEILDIVFGKFQP